MAAMTAAENKFPDPPSDQPGWLALAQGVWATQAHPDRHRFCSLSKSLVHSLGQPAVHPLDHVALGVEGDAYAGMSQKLLHVLLMLAGHEQYRCAGVA